MLSLAISGKCSVYTVAQLVLHGANLNVADELKRNLLHQSVLNDNVLLLDFFYRYSNINLNLKDIVAIILFRHF